MIWIGFAKYEQGQDPLGDAIDRHTRKFSHFQADNYPYPHCFLLCGSPDIGYHRSEVFTSGLSYVWYPPDMVDFPEGLYFRIENDRMELDAMYKVLDPWTRTYARCSKKHIIKVMRGELRVLPEIDKGAFSCITFVLWALGMLSFPHRPPELIECLRSHSDLFEEKEYASKTETQGIRWIAE
jgi:hypothetical protein